MEYVTLTPEQEAIARVEAQKWVKISCCTDPANRDGMEKAVIELYRRIREGRPELYWFDGPYQACMEGPKRIGLENNMENARKVFRLREWGCEFAWWVGWHVVCRDVVGVKYTDDQLSLLDTWELLVNSGGWWFMGDGGAFLCERHKILSFDERGQPHSETGPAVECRDGYKVYAWHGTTVPEQWIMSPDTVDPKLALTHENIEQRRALAERLGWSKVIAELKPRQLHKDKFGELLEVDLPDSPKEKFVKVRCATGRDFVLPCDPNAKTAVAAVAASYGVSVQLYKKLQART